MQRNATGQNNKKEKEQIQQISPIKTSKAPIAVVFRFPHTYKHTHTDRHTQTHDHANKEKKREQSQNIPRNHRERKKIMIQKKQKNVLKNN